METLVSVDDQPILAGFFGEGKWLSEYITPYDLEVQAKFGQLTEGLTDTLDKIESCWHYVASNIAYVTFVKGSLSINGKTSVQQDLWQSPSLCMQTEIGNCANKSFLLTSMLRNILTENEVYCILGNLYNGSAGGHAWVQVNIGGIEYVLESTRDDIPMLVPVAAADRYETVHLFNDKLAYVVEGKTVMEPFTRCFSTWLRDYLDFAYINGDKR